MNDYIDFLKSHRNIILHGAPGTGKTFLAKKIAAEMNAEIEFVQFHPSYDYSDFVEGLRPTKPNDNGYIGFKREDGIFKKFCKTALENINNSESNDSSKIVSVKAKLIEYVENCILNSTELKTKNGSKFTIYDCDDKTIYISNNTNSICKQIELSIKIVEQLILNYYTKRKIEDVKEIKDFLKHKVTRQEDSYYFTIVNKLLSDIQIVIKDESKIGRKNFIFIVDEINRGDMSKIFGELFFSIDPGYRGLKGKVKTQYQNLIDEDDEFADGFFIPENVYIIGTMNDIDRSVESMDFAMRRRFSFKEVTAEDSAKNMKIDYSENSPMRRLNEKILESEFSLGKDYQIGGSYFLKENVENEENEEKTVPIDFNNKDEISYLWKNKLEPLLKEYLRGQRDIEQKLDQLKTAYEGSSAS